MNRVPLVLLVAVMLTCVGVGVLIDHLAKPAPTGDFPVALSSVRAQQQVLHDEGLLPDANDVDNKWGPKTEKALETYLIEKEAARCFPGGDIYGRYMRSKEMP